MNQKENEASAAESADALDAGEMSLIEHLEELRERIIKMLLAVAIGSGIAWCWKEELLAALMEPAGKLYYMQPAEAFFTYMKVAIFAGFLLMSPFVFYQVWRFFVPALTRRERLVISIGLPSSLLLFFAGIAFAFFFVLPVGMKFLMGFTTDTLQPLFSIEKYFDFLLAFLLPFGFIFEMPLIIIVLAQMGIVSSAFLQKQQRMVIFLAFVIAAVISPTPDAWSQIMIAVPMVLLYEGSYFFVRYLMRK